MRYGQAAATLLVLMASLFAFSGSAWAQSCGGSAGPSLGAGAAAEGPWLREGKATARLSAEYEVRDQTYKGSDRVPNDFDESVYITRLALEIRYGITDDWSASVTPTYPHFTYRLKPPGGERIEQVFRGPGDTLVALGRRLMGSEEPLEGPPAEACAEDAPAAPDAPMLFHEEPRRPWSVSLWGGVSVPTGSPEEPNPAVVTSDVTVANLQTGTGTFDPFLRARLDWTPAETWSAFAEASVLYPLYENRFDYRTADSESVVVGASVPLVSRFSASLSLMYQRVGTDQFEGDDVGVGGAQWIYVIPGVGWELAESLFLDASVRLPLWRRTETKLADSNAIWQAGLTFYF